MNITDLPSDIICKIIKFGQESIESSRLISQRWNRLVADHLNSPKSWRNLPPIHYLRWDIRRRENILFISAPVVCSKYFGIDGSAFETNTDDVPESDSKPDSVHRSAKIAKRKVPNFQHLFNRCSTIERVELIMVDIKHSRHVANLFNTLRGVKVGEFVIPETYIHRRNAKAAILNLLDKRSVKGIILSGGPLHGLFARIAPFIQSVMGLIESVEIVDVYSDAEMRIFIGEWQRMKSRFNTITGLHAQFYSEYQTPDKVACGIFISVDDVN